MSYVNRYTKGLAVLRYGGTLAAHSKQFVDAVKTAAKREVIAREIGATVIMDEIILTPEQAVVFAERCKAEGL